MRERRQQRIVEVASNVSFSNLAMQLTKLVCMYAAVLFTYEYIYEVFEYEAGAAICIYAAALSTQPTARRG
jgi:hypothetical protein